MADPTQMTCTTSTRPCSTEPARAACLPRSSLSSHSLSRAAVARAGQYSRRSSSVSVTPLLAFHSPSPCPPRDTMASAQVNPTFTQLTALPTSPCTLLIDLLTRPLPLTHGCSPIPGPIAPPLLSSLPAHPLTKHSAPASPPPHSRLRNHCDRNVCRVPSRSSRVVGGWGQRRNTHVQAVGGCDCRVDLTRRVVPHSCHGVLRSSQHRIRAHCVSERGTLLHSTLPSWLCSTFAAARLVRVARAVSLMTKPYYQPPVGTAACISLDLTSTQQPFKRAQSLAQCSKSNASLQVHSSTCTILCASSSSAGARVISLEHHWCAYTATSALVATRLRSHVDKHTVGEPTKAPTLTHIWTVSHRRTLACRRTEARRCKSARTTTLCSGSTCSLLVRQPVSDKGDLDVVALDVITHNLKNEVPAVGGNGRERLVLST
jgi:hypothetical protein